MTRDTVPEVFIIESLRAEDVAQKRKEGDLIARILRMGGRKPIYKYVATRNEFGEALQIFVNKKYRYLHISSHGGKELFEFQFGEMAIGEFQHFVQGKLGEKRVFVSACEVVNHKNHELANAVLRNSGCYSLVGSADPIDFDAAAIFWSNFYYLAYHVREENESMSMKKALIRNLLKRLTSLYHLKLNYYFNNNSEIELERFVNGRKKNL
ncbi:MAG: hypothetical protein C3F13_02905 [Anaerolineales bacterium]|nr:MAG: hypothetical protein C3F13_02905 [Anaerolineales bacterium]